MIRKVLVTALLLSTAACSMNPKLDKPAPPVAPI